MREDSARVNCISEKRGKFVIILIHIIHVILHHFSKRATHFICLSVDIYEPSFVDTARRPSTEIATRENICAARCIAVHHSAVHHSAVHNVCGPPIHHGAALSSLVGSLERRNALM